MSVAFSDGPSNVCVPDVSNQGFSDCETHLDCGYSILDRSWGFCAGGYCSVMVE